MLYTILIFRDFIFKENALFTYFIVFFLYETVKTTESILNSDDIVYPFFIFRLFVFVPHFVDVYVYAGTINRSPTAADGLPFRCKQPAYNAIFTHETRGEHSVRRRGRFIAPVS